MTSSFRSSSRAALALAVLASVATSSQAVNLLTNGSFEKDFQAAGTYSILPSLIGWQSLSGGIELRNNLAGKAQDGFNFVELDTTRNSLAYQPLDTKKDQQYQLTFWYSPRENVLSASNGIEVFWNGVSVGSYSGNGASVGNDWRMYSATVWGNGGASVLAFEAIGVSDSYGGSLDNISLTAVPESETYAMMLAGIGVVGFVAARRRRMM